MEKTITAEQLRSAIQDAVSAEVRAAMKDFADGELKKLSRTPRPGEGNKILNPESFLDDKGQVEKGASGFRGLREFCFTIATNKGDSRLENLIASKALTEGDPESAGILVPIEYQDQLIKLAIEKGKIFPLCSMTDMKTAECKVPVAASLDESSGQLYGGIEFAWIDEGAEKTEKDFKLQRVGLKAKKCVALCKASNELLEDSSPKAEAVLRDLFSDAFKNLMDNIVIQGTGAGQPQGILSAPCLYTVAKESGQAANTIVWNNIKKLMSRIYPDGRDFSYWIINDSCLDQIWNLSVPIGTGGSTVMIASGQGADIKPVPATLMSRPIIWCSHGSALGTKGDIILADLRQYLIGIRKALTIDVSIHVYFKTNYALFRIEARLDGQPVLPSTMKTRTNFEVSPFVTLATRS